VKRRVWQLGFALINLSILLLKEVSCRRGKRRRRRGGEERVRGEGEERGKET
jgi:hypothetical protein